VAVSGRLSLVSPGSLAARAGGDAFESMLSGWKDQQLARNLNVVTIDARERLVRRFRVHAQVWPWEWLPGHLEAWVAELRVVEHRAAFHHPQLPVGRGWVLRLRVRPRVWVGGCVLVSVRVGTEPGVPGREPGRTHHRV
jgi:hypothetical protein